MDMNQMLANLKGNVTPLSVILFALLVTSEVLGNMESVQASSIYQVVKAVLMAFKEQVWPTKPPVA